MARPEGGGIPDALVRLTVMRKGHRAAKSGASLPTETGAGSDGAVQESDHSSQMPPVAPGRPGPDLGGPGSDV